MDDRNDENDAAPAFETEQERRDYYDSLIEGPDWQTPEPDGSAQSGLGHYRYRAALHADIRANAMLEIGVRLGERIVEGRKAAAEDDDDASKPADSARERHGTDGEEEPGAAGWTGEAAAASAPRVAEALVGLFCERDRREDMLAVLADRFEEKARDHGARLARRWYWRQVARSFGPFAWQWVRRMAELETLLKLIGF